MRYVALINVPGYLPMDDEPPVFDTPNEAWSYLAEERERGEDATPGWPVTEDGLETGEYSDTLAYLRHIASSEHEHGSPYADWPTAADGTGVIYGDTPGVTGDHDLGLAYCVAAIEEENE